GAIGMGIRAITDIFSSVTSAITGLTSQCTAAWQSQIEAETKLSAVMQNTMGASQSEIQSILDLAAAQQKLGVIGDEVQLAGAQELSTYLEKKESLEKLMPVMNDMLAQQYGMNASQESAAQIATMMGKVMDGQVGALSRYGYKFTEAQEKILKFGTEEQRAATLAEVVSESVGGVNEALAQTDAGRLKQASNSFGDMQERLGQFIEKTKIAALPLFDLFMGMADSLIPILDTFIQPLTKAVNWIVEKINWLVPILQKMFSPALDILKKITDGTGTLHSWFSDISDLFTTTILPALQNMFDCIWNVVGSVVEFFQNSELLKDVFSGLTSIIGGLFEIVSGVFSLLSDLFLNVIRPIWDVFEWVYRKVKELITGKPVKKETITKTEEKKTTTTGTNMTNLQNTVNAGSEKANLNKELSSKTSAVATGGTRNTVVNIQMGKFFDNMIFNGGVKENSQDIEKQFREMLLRVLYSAQMS
ncbi:MAG: hypothetical protein J5588_06390, partial [Bacteroidales bacterium]|nr:hypothetical protein [Bacteroidales bacterium]